MRPLDCESALPRPEDLLRVVLPRRVVDLVQDVQEFARVCPPDRAFHEVTQGVLHGARLRMARVEEHQDEIGEPDDVVRNAKDGGALLVGIEPGRVDDDLSPDPRARARLELEVGVDAAPLAGRDLLDVTAHLVERKPRIGVEGESRQCARRSLPGTEADRGEAVVYRLVAGHLDRLAEVTVDEGRLAGREGAENRDEGPPRDLAREGLVGWQEAEPPRDLVEAPEGAHRVEKNRVLFAKVAFEAVELLGEGFVHRTGSSCTASARQWPDRPPDFSTR